MAPPAGLDRGGPRGDHGPRPPARGRGAPGSSSAATRGRCTAAPVSRSPWTTPVSQHADLPEPEREFLETSKDARDRERREEAERIARQARANRRLRWQRAAIAVALVVALVGGFIALDQRGQAEQERRVATARELAAAAVANIPDDPERSMLLALAAIEETRSHGADGAARGRRGPAPRRDRVPRPAQRPRTSVEGWTGVPTGPSS